MKNSHCIFEHIASFSSRIFLSYDFDNSSSAVQVCHSTKIPERVAKPTEELMDSEGEVDQCRRLRCGISMRKNSCREEGDLSAK